MAGKDQIGEMDCTVQICIRSLVQPAPGSAEPRHDYRVLFTTRAKVRTVKGANQFAQVNIGGKNVTHVFKIRHTRIPFDTTHRLRTATGELFQILLVDDENMAGDMIKISCCDVGSEAKAAAR